MVGKDNLQLYDPLQGQICPIALEKKSPLNNPMTKNGSILKRKLYVTLEATFVNLADHAPIGLSVS